MTRCRSYTFFATLEVLDSQGNSATHTEKVDPSRKIDLPPANQMPVADFSTACNFLECQFDAGASSDADGLIVAYEWDFGDSTIESGETVLHSYSNPASYTVLLRVTDDAGATGLRARSISVAAEPPPGFNLTATGTRARGGLHTGHLKWTGAASTLVEIYRNGAQTATVPNSGSNTDATGRRGRGEYTYQVCEEGTSTCSNEATVIFD